jgi:hypothetical protein
MNNEFKKSKSNNETRYVLENSATVTTGSVATAPSSLGKVQKRGNILAQEAGKDKVPATTPRNFVAKNAKSSGAGAHKDKKREQKQGTVKHKKPYMESLKSRLDNLQVRMTEARMDPESLEKLMQLRRQLEQPKAAQSAPELTSQQQSEIDQWEKDFAQRMATRSTDPVRSKPRRDMPGRRPAATVAPEKEPVKPNFPKKHSELVALKKNLDKVIDVKQKIESIIASLGGEDALPPNIKYAIDDSIYAHDAEKDGYQGLLDKNLKSLDILNNHRGYKKLVKKDKVWEQGVAEGIAGKEVDDLLAKHQDNEDMIKWIQYYSAKRFWNSVEALEQAAKSQAARDFADRRRQGVAEGYDTVMSIVGTSDWNMRGWKIRWGEINQYTGEYKKMYQGIVNKDGIHPDMGRTGAHFVVFTPINTGDQEVENKEQAIVLDFDSRVEVFDPKKNDWVWLDTEIKPADTSKDYGSSRPSKSGWQKPSKYGWTDYNPEESVAEGASDFVSNAIEAVRSSVPGLKQQDFLDEMYMYIENQYGQRAAEMMSNAGQNAYDEWYDDYLDNNEQGVAEGGSRRLVMTDGDGAKVFKIYKDIEWGEYVVKFFVNGRHQTDADYHTDDKNDAIDTAQRFISGEVDEGYSVMPGINKDRYQERPGLEGPFTAKNGKVVYYDPKEGKYYDPDSDFYIDHDEWQAMNKGTMEGAKVDRQAKHIATSMMKKGKSKKEADSIAWAHIKHPKNEDAYFESLNVMLERQLEPEMGLNVWKQNFLNANPYRYKQFKNKTAEKKR